MPARLAQVCWFASRSAHVVIVVEIELIIIVLISMSRNMGYI